MMHSVRVTWALSASSATRRVAPSGKVATTMIFLKLILETSGAVHVSFTEVELQAVKPRNDKAAKVAAAKRVMDFIFKRVRRTGPATNDVVVLQAFSDGGK